MKLEDRMRDLERQNKRLHEDNMRVFNMAKRVEETRNNEYLYSSSQTIEQLNSIYDIFDKVAKRFRDLEEDQETMAEDYARLQESYDELKAEYSILKQGVRNLVQANRELKSQYDKLQTLQETQYKEIKNILTNVWGKCIDTESMVLDHQEKIEDLESDVEAIWSEQDRPDRSEA